MGVQPAGQPPEGFDSAEAIGKALQHHTAGNLQAAEALYRELLRVQPEHAEALHLLGVLAYQTKRPDVAQNLIRHAIDIDGAQARYHNALAVALMASGKRKEAIASYRHALALQPDFGEAHNNLGNALREEGLVDDAMACYRRALELNDKIVEAHNNLANLLKQKGDLSGAVAAFRRALALNPGYAEAYNNLGDALEAMGALEEAVDCCRRAISLRPDFVEAYCNLGNAFTALGRLDEALAAHEHAIGLRPDYALAHSNKGVVLYVQGRVDDAIASYRRALELSPGLASAQWGLGVAHLMKGEYGPGWEGYEWRWEGCPYLKGGRPPLPQPPWKGESLAGRRLLIYAEQGLGDEMMFASIIPEILRETADCLIECSPKLEKLFQRSFRGAGVFGNDRDAPGWQGRLAEWLGRFPAADYQSPTGSMALHRRQSLAQFPRHRGYLKADPRSVRYWKGRLAESGGGVKVGVSWRGGLQPTGTARRSVSLKQLLPVLRQRGFRFVSLQYTDCSEEIERFSEQSGIDIAHWQEALDDYDETAALVKALDLVLSVCTSAIHLGGALGQRTWVMAPHVPEWRYGVSGEAMPWYPQVRIFRQPAPGDWDSVFKRVADELRDLRLA